MSDVTEWTRISDLFKDNLDLENPFDYKAVLDTYRKIVDWISAGGDYWGEECTCVEQLIVQSIDQEVLDQSETFDTILRVDMLDWSDMFDGEGGEMEQALIDKTRDINENLRTVLESIQMSLKTSPEKAALVSMDTMVVSMMASLGMVGKVESCSAIEIAIQDLYVLMNLVNFDIEGGGTFTGWPRQVALCSVNLPETYELCQPPLPWPHYWVQDNYLGEQVFFGMQEEAEVFMSEYVGRVETSVSSLVDTVDLDRHTLDTVYDMLQYALWVNCS